MIEELKQILIDSLQEIECLKQRKEITGLIELIVYVSDISNKEVEFEHEQQKIDFILQKINDRSCELEKSLLEVEKLHLLVSNLKLENIRKWK